MEKKYISENRYKKSFNKKRRNLKDVKNNINKNATKSVSKKVNKKVVKPQKTKLNVKRKKKQDSKIRNIVICIFLLVIIGVISRAILKDENEPFIPISFGSEANKEEIAIGIITEDNLLSENVSNVVMQELNNYTKDMIIRVNSDYSIEYNVVSGIEKKTNTEYILSFDDKYKDAQEKVKNTINSIISNENSVYYSKVKNISDIILQDNGTILIKLKNSDPYFIYNLNIPISFDKKSTNSNYIMDESSNNSKVIYNRNKKADSSLPARIIVKKYKDMYKAVEAYKLKAINCFVTNADNTENIIGKYEYNIMSFRNGKTTFLLLNNKSKLLKSESIRKAVVYGIDRDSIIKSILSSKGDIIDLPYIYDETKYKYDIYAADNILLADGYSKVNKVYTKTENYNSMSIELKLLVNKNDKTNIKIANKIKKNLESIGIVINIEKLTESNLKKKISKSDYDMVLANVTLNENPDISFIINNLFITDSIKESISKIDASPILDLKDNISNLQNELSNNISIIGIYADTSYIVYSKDIVGIENISYLNLFKNLFN